MKESSNHSDHKEMSPHKPYKQKHEVEMKMEDDLDVIKMGAWMNTKELFQKKRKLFYYWLFLCLVSTMIQLLFLGKLIQIIIVELFKTRKI